jgi:hypothetical protein
VSHTEEAAPLAQFGSEYLVRTSGTFSYISGYTAFLSFVGFLAIGYNMARGWRVKNNIAPLLALTLVVGAMFTTGSRAPVYILVATAPVVLVMAVVGRVLTSQTAVRLFLLLPVIAIAALNLSSRAVEGFAERVSTSSDAASTRIFAPLYQVTQALSEGPALGMGIGTTHPSALTIMGSGSFWWLHDLLVEEEMARVAVELGVMGLVLTCLLRVLIAAFALKCAMSFKDSAYRALGIGLMIYLALGIHSQVIFNATIGLYYWGALGLMLTMRRFEQLVEAERLLRRAGQRVGRKPPGLVSGKLTVNRADGPSFGDRRGR